MKIIAYVISRTNSNKLVMDTLNQALAKRKDVYGCILHSDQGFQYTSNEYKTICQDKGIIISMSSKGSPVDNSPIESWHSLLKKEVLYSNNITSLVEYITYIKYSPSGNRQTAENIIKLCNTGIQYTYHRNTDIDDHSGFSVTFYDKGKVYDVGFSSYTEYKKFAKWNMHINASHN